MGFEGEDGDEEEGTEEDEGTEEVVGAEGEEGVGASAEESEPESGSESGKVGIAGFGADDVVPLELPLSLPLPEGVSADGVSDGTAELSGAETSPTSTVKLLSEPPIEAEPSFVLPSPFLQAERPNSIAKQTIAEIILFIFDTPP